MVIEPAFPGLVSPLSPPSDVTAPVIIESVISIEPASPP